jgi:hypothetical protein
MIGLKTSKKENIEEKNDITFTGLHGELSTQNTEH